MITRMDRWAFCRAATGMACMMFLLAGCAATDAIGGPAGEEVRSSRASGGAHPAAAAEPPAPDEASRRAFAALRRSTDVQFEAVPLSEVLAWFRDAAAVNCFINWRALEAAGIDHDAPVTLHLKNVSFEQALRYALRDAGGGTVRLDFAVVDGVVNISTAEDLGRDATVRVYPIAGLLAVVPTTAPSESLFSDEQRADRIRKLIMDNVDPDSWRESGGTIGLVSELNGKLVITQTEGNHAAIRKLLDELARDDAAVAQK